MAKAALGMGAVSLVLALIGLSSPITAAYGMFFGMLGFIFGAFSLPKEEGEEGGSGNVVAVILPAVAIICSAVIGLL